MITLCYIWGDWEIDPSLSQRSHATCHQRWSIISFSTCHLWASSRSFLTTFIFAFGNANNLLKVQTTSNDDWATGKCFGVMSDFILRLFIGEEAWPLVTELWDVINIMECLCWTVISGDHFCPSNIDYVAYTGSVFCQPYAVNLVKLPLTPQCHQHIRGPSSKMMTSAGIQWMGRLPLSSPNWRQN